MRPRGPYYKSPKAVTYPSMSTWQRHICTIEENKTDVCDVLVDKEQYQRDPSQSRSLGKTADVASTEVGTNETQKVKHTTIHSFTCVCV